MGDLNLGSDFHRNLQLILDDDHLSIDQRLEHLGGLLNDLEPALLEAAAKLTDEEIAHAFLEFVRPAAPHREGCEERFIAALVGAAELKRRADQAGLDVMRYAHLVRVKRELGRRVSIPLTDRPEKR